jgi:acetyl-CoA synthetase
MSFVFACRVPHPVKGESIYAYVTLVDDAQPSAKLHAELINLVKTQIGSFATPDVLHWAPGEASRIVAQ